MGFLEGFYKAPLHTFLGNQLTLYFLDLICSLTQKITFTIYEFLNYSNKSIIRYFQCSITSLTKKRTKLKFAIYIYKYIDLFGTWIKKFEYVEGLVDFLDIKLRDGVIYCFLNKKILHFFFLFFVEIMGSFWTE